MYYSKKVETSFFVSSENTSNYWLLLDATDFISDLGCLAFEDSCIECGELTANLLEYTVFASLKSNCCFPEVY